MKNEERYLQTSLYGAAFMAFFGVLMGVFARSQMLVFDGLYSFAGVLMSMVMLIVSRFLKKEDPKRYHYGKATVEPLVLTLNYLLLLMIIAASLVTALMALFQGGRMMALEIAMLYSVVTVGLCFFMTQYLRKKNERLRSPLVKAEMYQWRLDGLITGAVMVAFVMAYVLSFFPLTARVALYVDPVMVLLVSAYFIYLSYKELKIQLLQLMGAAPSSKLSQRIEKYIHKINQTHRFEDAIVRLSLAGRMLYVDIDFIVGETSEFDSILRQDHLRRTLDKELQAICKTQLWMTVVFTKDRTLAI